MPTPRMYASGGSWQSNGSADYLHIVNAGGTIIGWIDSNGVLQGTLANGGSGAGVSSLNGLTGPVVLAAGANITLTPAGNTITIASTGGGSSIGFASGSTVANSTGNTPTNGFTLSDGATTSITFDPTSNPAIQLFDTSQPTATALMEINKSGSGEVMVEDASSNDGALGVPNGAGLTLTGAGGTSIISDGTVPSTTWNDGVGDSALVEAMGISVTDPVGDLSFMASTEINTTLSTGESIDLAVSSGAAVLTMTGASKIITLQARATPQIQISGSTSGVLALLPPAVAGTTTQTFLPITGNIAVETAAPATATSTGVTGSIAFDSTHFYVAVATNTWVRALLTTF